MGRKINVKKIYTMEISPDFTVEATQNGKVVDYWLCRNQTGRRVFMFGTIPEGDDRAAKTPRGELRVFEKFLTNPMNSEVRVFCKELLDNGEALANDSFEIILISDAECEGEVAV